VDPFALLVASPLADVVSATPVEQVEHVLIVDLFHPLVGTEKEDQERDLDRVMDAPSPV
jgi:hypothetical protein